MKNYMIMFVIAGALSGAAANAETFTVTTKSTPTARVSFYDADIGSPAGLDRLRGRVRSAAAGLCLENNVEPLEIHLLREKCFHTALRNGFAQIDRALAARDSDSPSTVAVLAFNAQ
jgi:UrcA family protein